MGTPSFQLFACERWYTISPIKMVGRGKSHQPSPPILETRMNRGVRTQQVVTPEIAIRFGFFLSIHHPRLEHTINFACSRAGRVGPSQSKKKSSGGAGVERRATNGAGERQIVPNRFRRRRAEDRISPRALSGDFYCRTVLVPLNLCHYIFVEQPRPLL